MTAAERLQAADDRLEVTGDTAMLLSLSERQRYYADPRIQMRLGEFLGGDSPGSATAVYFAPGTEWESLYRQPHALKEWAGWLEKGAELNRSLWDRQSLVAHLDIEYVNFDYPAYVYLEDGRIFEQQEPVVAAAESIFKTIGLRPLHLLTGRGHHFVWRIERQSWAFEQLTFMGHLSDSLQRLYASSPGPAGELVDRSLGAAFSGLGLVMEYLAQQVKRYAAKECTLPVELAAIETGGGRQGREMIAVDITEYADPLCSRVMRVPFSIYLKPWQQRFALGNENIEHLPPIFLIPLNKIPLEEGIRIRRDPDAVKELAARTSTDIPEGSKGMKGLVKDYISSPLATFHDWFYGEDHDPASIWPNTYDRAPLDTLPPCVNHILTYPNDLLLRPGCVERVVRVLLAVGWHPRHIAGLVRSKYERDFGWGDQWDRYDPATRADFYARVFTGLFMTGTDNLVDFNCQSAREEGLCFIENCSENLAHFRDSLINRKKYERLGCRPFNRLFLPAEHS